MKMTITETKVMPAVLVVPVRVYYPYFSLYGSLLGVSGCLDITIACGLSMTV